MYRYKKIKLSDGSTIDEHRLVWEQAHGPIPKGMVIHHKNGDGRDNRLSNLELCSRSEHYHRHPEAEQSRTKIAADRLRIISPVGMAWCGSCRQHKVVDEFHRGTRWNGYQPHCKECRKKVRKRI